MEIRGIKDVIFSLKFLFDWPTGYKNPDAKKEKEKKKDSIEMEITQEKIERSDNK